MVFIVGLQDCLMSDGQVDENVNVGQLAVADAGRLEEKDVGFSSMCSKH